MRAFLGIALDAEVKRTLHGAAGEWQKTAHAKFYTPDRYHITLAFLGDVEAERLPLLRSTVSRVAWKTFSIEGGEAGTFGTKGILWFGVRRPCEQLMATQKAVALALRLDGWRFEDTPYVPHITVARGAREIGRTPPAPKWRQDVRSITLFESVRRETTYGCRLCYEPVWEVEAAR